MADISEIVSEFIRRYIDSLHALEILLFLRAAPEKEFGAMEISRVLCLDGSAVVSKLIHFKSEGLVQRRKISEDLVYGYGPLTSELGYAVDELAKAYSTHRVRVIDAILSQPSSKTQTFRTDTRSENDGKT